MPTDDLTLLREFAATRSETAFAQLVTRHLPLVHSAALRRTGDAHLAEEVAQAVFLILAHKAGKLNQDTILSGWLYRTTQYAAADALKQRHRRQQREHQAYMETTFNPPETDAAWQQIAPVLETAMDSLGERDRQAVLLRFFENKTLADVGTALGMSEDGARLRVNRALDKLRAKLGKAGVTLGATLIASAVGTNSVQAAPAALAAKVSVIAAKGVAATTSIAALVKGTMNMMSWAKAKIAVFLGTAIIVAAGTTIVVMDKSKTSPMDAFIADPELTNFRGAPPLAIVQETHISKIIGQTYISGRNEFGKLVGRDVSMNMMLSEAYDIDWPHILFASPMPTNTYDYLISATNHAKEVFQAEIQKVTGFTGKREIRSVPVLVLKATAKTPEKMKASRAKHSSLDKTDIRLNGQSYYLRYRNMIGFCVELQNTFGKPVLDETGITNQADIYVDWRRNRIPVPKGYSFKQAMWEHNETLKQAIRDQLGLEFISTNMPVEMLVVEKVK